jgi:hypothetical protein
MDGLMDVDVALAIGDGSRILIRTVLNSDSKKVVCANFCERMAVTFKFASASFVKKAGGLAAQNPVGFSPVLFLTSMVEKVLEEASLQVQGR